LSAVNYVGVRQGSAVQTFFTIVKLAVVVLIVALGATHVAGHGMPQSGQPTAALTSGGILAAMVAGLFAYGGWHMVSYAADETQQPARTIPRALLAGTLIVTLAYMAVNASYVAVLPIAKVTSSNRVAADFADVIIGGGGADALSALVIVSTLGAMTGIILAGPRVYMAMARDGLLFRWAAALHPRYSTPYFAIALQALWSSVLVLTGSYRALFTRVVYTEWIFFALMAASLFVLRRRAGYAPAYRVPAYALLAGTFVVCSLTIVGYQIVSQPRESVWGLGLVLAGLPVYALWQRSMAASTDPSLRSG